MALHGETECNQPRRGRRWCPIMQSQSDPGEGYTLSFSVEAARGAFSTGLVVDEGGGGVFGA
jgi:hypothetical protein